MILDIGCGDHKHAGSIGIDKELYPCADYRIDVETAGLPAGDNTVDEVYMSHILEHISDVNHVLGEVWRVCRDGARVHISGPHVNAWGHIDHKRGFTTSSFRWDTRFRQRGARLTWSPRMRSQQGYKLSPLNRRYYWLVRLIDNIITPLANLCPEAAERLWQYYVGGFSEIKVELEVVK